MKRTDDKEKETTLIRRYANRRLYDTRRSHHLTLEALAERVREGEKVVIVDARTGEDITRRIFLQVILLERLELADALPKTLLEAIIRMPNRHCRTLLAAYLKDSFLVFEHARAGLGNNLRALAGRLKDLTRLNRERLECDPAFLPSPASHEKHAPSPDPLAPPWEMGADE